MTKGVSNEDLRLKIGFDQSLSQMTPDFTAGLYTDLDKAADLYSYSLKARDKVSRKHFDEFLKTKIDAAREHQMQQEIAS